MRTGKQLRSAAIVAVALVAVSGCSTKGEAGSSDEGEGSARVSTDVGVEGDTITLGVLTDLTGVFAAQGRDITNANTLYWRDNRVCDRYNVELTVSDTGYVPQQAVQLYSSMKDDVLAMQQTIGSPINTALAADYEADSIVNIPLAFSQEMTQIPGTGVPGSTYDVEIANGYDYLLQEGLLREGDTIGHIYFTGDYGAGALIGTQAVAEELRLNVVEAEIKPTDQDMSSAVIGFAAEGVDVIVMSTAPGQVASAAAVAEAQALDVPILGNGPTFTAGLLQGPSAQWLKDHFYVATPFSSFDDHPDLLTSYAEEFPEATPSQAFLFGHGMAAIMDATLDRACENGDLTREGVLAAFGEVDEVDTDGVMVPVEGFELGRSPSLQSFILRPADVPGGAEVVQEAFEGQFAEDLAGS
jgi:ABC-type branched-subunit amino acid transport system substrate-binding protein